MRKNEFHGSIASHMIWLHVYHFVAVKYSGQNISDNLFCQMNRGLHEKSGLQYSIGNNTEAVKLTRGRV